MFTEFFSKPQTFEKNQRGYQVLWNVKLQKNVYFILHLFLLISYWHQIGIWEQKHHQIPVTSTIILEVNNRFMKYEANCSSFQLTLTPEWLLAHISLPNIFWSPSWHIVHLKKSTNQLSDVHPFVHSKLSFDPSQSKVVGLKQITVYLLELLTFPWKSFCNKHAGRTNWPKVTSLSKSINAISCFLLIPCWINCLTLYSTGLGGKIFINFFFNFSKAHNKTHVLI